MPHSSGSHPRKLACAPFIGHAGQEDFCLPSACPKLLSKLNGLLIVWGLPTQPKATTGCVALRLRHYKLYSTNRTPEEGKVVCEICGTVFGPHRGLGWEEEWGGSIEDGSLARLICRWGRETAQRPAC